MFRDELFTLPDVLWTCYVIMYVHPSSDESSLPWRLLGVG